MLDLIFPVRVCNDFKQHTCQFLETSQLSIAVIKVWILCKENMCNGLLYFSPPFFARLFGGGGGGERRV